MYNSLGIHGTCWHKNMSSGRGSNACKRRRKKKKRLAPCWRMPGAVCVVRCTYLFPIAATVGSQKMGKWLEMLVKFRKDLFFVMSFLLAAEKQLHCGRRWTKTSALGSKTREPCWWLSSLQFASTMSPCLFVTNRRFVLAEAAPCFLGNNVRMYNCV